MGTASRGTGKAGISDNGCLSERTPSCQVAGSLYYDVNGMGNVSPWLDGPATPFPMRVKG